jgi:crotonobetainyl-CoA:carnitine CoA-transferase CaiB-like acyl-CoA transferase
MWFKLIISLATLGGQTTYNTKTHMKQDKQAQSKSQTPTPATPTPMPVTPEAPITLASLTPDQLKALHAELKAQKKARSATRGDRNTLLDKMLQEKDGAEFKHTTADILAAMQAKSLVASNLSKEERAVELKHIQTRKQLLEKKPEFKGKVGYKASAGFNTLTLDRVCEWLSTQDLSKADEQRIINAMNAS